MDQDAGEGGGGGGNPPPDWRQSLPEPLRVDPSIQKFGSIEDLAKSYVSAQQLIGTKRLEAPSDKWDDTKWNQFYDSIGRPKDHKGYGIPDGVKPRDGITLDEAKLDATRQMFHKLGLTEKQGREVLGYYINSLNSTAEEESRTLAQRQETAMAELKGKYGDKLDEKLAAGKLAVEKVGGAAFKDFLNQSGAGNNPVMIETMIKIGELLGNDSSRGGGGDGSSFSGGQAQAQAELMRLRSDSKFIGTLTKREDPGHRAALELWEKLHAAAFPGKQMQ